MPPQLLCDPKVFPTDEVIFSHIRKAKPLWQAIFGHVQQTYPTATPQWRYYNDGKSWLLKLTKKSKTLCWVSLAEGAFRMTFYFPERARQQITKSALPPELKQQFTDGRAFGKIRGITILFQRKADLEAAQLLLALKDRFK